MALLDGRCSATECTGTSVTLWTGDIRGFSLVFAVASKYLISSSRRWECGNREGISKECGKGGKPALLLSTLSTLCLHGLPSASTGWVDDAADFY
jgi:hypothetical protein